MKEPKRIWDDNASAITPCNTSEYLIQTIFHCSVISFAILCQFEHFWNTWPSAVGGKLPLCKQEFGMKMLLLLNCQTLNKSAASAQTLQKRCWVSVPLWMAHRSRKAMTSTLSAASGLYFLYFLCICICICITLTAKDKKTDQGGWRRLLWVLCQVCDLSSCISFLFVCVFVLLQVQKTKDKKTKRQIKEGDDVYFEWRVRFVSCISFVFPLYLTKWQKDKRQKYKKTGRRRLLWVPCQVCDLSLKTLLYFLCICSCICNSLSAKDKRQKYKKAD